MSRYRKIEVRTWGDEKFKSLSPIPPCGQGLWFFLLTGPHTGPIPGLFRAGRAAMAEELEWSLEDFDKAFAEALSKGMVKADFKAKVVWIPNAITHNKPESPNVVRSWASEFDLIPECALKREAYESLKAFICALGEGYAKAFEEAFEKPFGKPSAKTMPNQEQEQEQDKEPTHPPCATPVVSEVEPPPVAIEEPEKPGRPPASRSSDPSAVFAMHTKWTPSPEIHDMALVAGLAPSVPDEFNGALAEFRAHWISMPFKRTQAEWDKALIKSLKADKTRPIIPKPANVIRHPRTGGSAQKHQFDDVDYHQGGDDDGHF